MVKKRKKFYSPPKNVAKMQKTNRNVLFQPNYKLLARIFVIIKIYLFSDRTFEKWFNKNLSIYFSLYYTINIAYWLNIVTLNTIKCK